MGKLQDRLYGLYYKFKNIEKAEQKDLGEIKII